MMRRSSSSRPTNAVAGAPAGRSSDTTRYAATLSDRPFSEKTPTAVRVPSSLTSRCVDRRARRRVVAVRPAPDGLRIEAVVQRRRSDQVGEDDRDDLARHRLVGGAGNEGSTAGLAELRVRLAFGTTCRAAGRERPAA